MSHLGSPHTYHAPPHALRALAGKYRTLASLRRDKLRGEPEPARDVFLALARAFPGCLRELDTLTLDELDARAQALEHAAEGHPPQPWMLWLHDYHQLLRAALQVKLRLKGTRAPDEPAVHAIVTALAASYASEGFVLTPAFVRAVAQPPRGRLNDVVLEQLCARHACKPEHVVRTLFPKHNASRAGHPEQEHPES